MAEGDSHKRRDRHGTRAVAAKIRILPLPNSKTILMAMQQPSEAATGQKKTGIQKEPA
ncbi:hypothetical protein OIU35_17815 [Boseaceae bacterium BT-24-1]|nr:hypothetical protein [Boseaceae bacterium BT-24-1]